MPSMNNNSVSMDALVQFKNPIKADLIDLRNSINAFEVDLQRQNNTIQSLSELIKKQETSKMKTDKKISELQKEIKRLTSPSSTSTSPRLRSPKDDFNSASANEEFPSSSTCNSSASSSSTVPKSLHKSSHKLQVHHHQTPIIHSTIINRCPRNTLPHRHQGNTVDRLPSGSQFDQNTPSPGTGSSTPYKDALMSSKGIIGVNDDTYLTVNRRALTIFKPQCVVINLNLFLKIISNILFLVTLLSRGSMRRSCLPQMKRR